MITFKINGQTVQGEEGQYILQVAEKYGIDIPTMCHHKALEPAGMCRICTVELFDGRRTRFVTACNYPIWEGMEVKTDTEVVHDGRKLIVEMLLARCPNVPRVQEMAKTYGVDKPRFVPEDDTCILCGLCTRICEKMGANAITLTDRGLDLKIDTPFSINTDACIGCGACAFVCPTGHITWEKIKETGVQDPGRSDTVRIRDGTGRVASRCMSPMPRPFPTRRSSTGSPASILKPAAAKSAPNSAVWMPSTIPWKTRSWNSRSGPSFWLPGFEPFDPSKFDTYSYAQHPNVITSMEMERILSASGPTGGHLVRLSDHKEPKKIAWFQCVGSRDLNRCDNAYCSSVCCMYAIKEAVIAKEHAGDDLDCAIFYMDMRTHGKDFERFYDRAREKSGVRFVRSRVHTITPVPGNR